MKRSAPISVGLLAALGLACGAGQTAEPGSSAEPPNIVLVMTDDQGYGDFGFAGNPVIETPHLDALATQSAQVERFYVSPVCTPTRASLMTGRYNYRTRAMDRYNGGLRSRKDSVLEGGIRSPLLVRWPARLPAGGEPVDRIAAHIDITPTLIDAAGVEPPAGLRLDGRSLLGELPEVAAALRDGYREWFEDMSGTRPDNYAPARIVVGSDHEPVTVLTRQDWRRDSEDQGWRPTSQGHWQLSAIEDTTFDVEVRLVAGSTGPLRLDIGDRTLSQGLAPEQRVATFEAVEAGAGDFALSASAGEGAERRGAHQIVLSRRSASAP